MQLKSQQDTISHPPDWQKLTSLETGVVYTLGKTTPPPPGTVRALKLQILRINPPSPNLHFSNFNSQQSIRAPSIPELREL